MYFLKKLQAKKQYFIKAKKLFYFLPGEVAFSNVRVDVSLLTSSSCVVLTVVGWPKISSYKLVEQVLEKTAILKKY